MATAEGQAHPAHRAHRDRDHRGEQSAPARVREGRARLHDGAGRSRHQRAGARQHAEAALRQGRRVSRARHPAGGHVHLLQHGRSGAGRLHERQDRAAARDQHGLQRRRGGARAAAGAGHAGHAARAAGRLRARRQLEGPGAVRSGRRQGAARQVRLHRPRQGRLARPARRQAAGAEDGVDARRAIAAVQRIVAAQPGGRRAQARLRHAEVAGPAQDGARGPAPALAARQHGEHHRRHLVPRTLVRRQRRPRQPLALQAARLRPPVRGVAQAARRRRAQQDRARDVADRRCLCAAEAHRLPLRERPRVSVGDRLHQVQRVRTRTRGNTSTSTSRCRASPCNESWAAIARGARCAARSHLRHAALGIVRAFLRCRRRPRAPAARRPIRPRCCASCFPWRRRDSTRRR